MLHEAALCSLRDIDRVATATMRSAARRKRWLVECDTVETVFTAHRDPDGQTHGRGAHWRSLAM